MNIHLSFFLKDITEAKVKLLKVFFFFKCVCNCVCSFFHAPRNPLNCLFQGHHPCNSSKITATNLEASQKKKANGQTSIIFIKKKYRPILYPTFETKEETGISPVLSHSDELNAPV